MEHSRYQRGFSLIELLVVFSIIVIITVVAVTSQSSFNKTLILANTAYDVALSLRAAETYGLGSRTAGITVNAGYGLHFDKATPSTFTLFADTYPAPSTSSVCHPTDDASIPTAQPGNCAYDLSQGEKITTYQLGNGITISNFCAFSGNGASGWKCAYTGSGGGGPVSTLDIVFVRPSPNPFISTNGSYSIHPFPITAACIELSSRYGTTRFVSVTASGSITANATSCP